MGSDFELELYEDQLDDDDREEGREMPEDNSYRKPESRFKHLGGMASLGANLCTDHAVTGLQGDQMSKTAFLSTFQGDQRIFSLSS